MALQLDNIRLMISKNGEVLSVRACVTKKSSEDSSCKNYYEREVVLSPQDSESLSDLFDSLKDQVKSEDSLS